MIVFSWLIFRKLLTPSLIFLVVAGVHIVFVLYGILEGDWVFLGSGGGLVQECLSSLNHNSWDRRCTRSDKTGGSEV